MKSYTRFLVTVPFVTPLTLAPPTKAQSLPHPIDLGIQNIPQETGVWCWAAVAQQIVLRLQGNTPRQCEMVSIVITNGADDQYCCSSMPPTNCMVTGELHDIQNLILRFSGRFSTIAPPTDPMTVYNALSQNRAIIMAVRQTPYDGHLVVIRGMEWVPTQYGPEPVLLVNDPVNYFSEPILFRNIAQYWEAAIVI